MTPNSTASYVGTQAGLPQLRAPLTPRLARRMLHYELGRMCSLAGVTHRELAARLGVSRPSVSQLVTGANFLSRATLEIVAGHLGYSHRLPYLLQLHQQARTSKASAADMPRSWDSDLELGLEAMACAITIVEFTCIPTLLHIDAYAHYLQHDSCALRNAVELNDLARRQQILRADSPTRLTWFGEEHGLRRQLAIVPKDLIRAQLHHLLTLAATCEVNLRIAPAGRSPLMPPPTFSLLTLDGDRQCALERVTNATSCVEDPASLDTYTQITSRLDQLALDTDQSCELVSKLVDAQERL